MSTPHLIRCVFVQLKCHVCGEIKEKQDMYMVDLHKKLGFVYNSDHEDCKKIIHKEINNFYTTSDVSPVKMLEIKNNLPIKFQRYNKVDEPLIDGKLVSDQLVIFDSRLYIRVNFVSDGKYVCKYTPLNNIVRNNTFQKPKFIFSEVLDDNVRSRWEKLVDNEFN